MAKPAQLLTTAAFILSLAASAGALVLPGSDVVANQQPLHGHGHGSLRWPSSSSAHNLESTAGPVRSAIDRLVDEVQSASGLILDHLADAFAASDDADDADDAAAFDLDDISTKTRPDDDQGHNHTIYEFIRRSSYTTKFADLVDKHPDVVALLNSTSGSNHTLFVPTNDAFDRIPRDHLDLSKEFVEAVLRYHVAEGDWPAKRLLSKYTVPTALTENKLGDEPQRLRITVGLKGVKIDFYSKVTEIDIVSTNGIIHAVDHVLVPPPFASRILNLFPEYFSTLLLAYEKTDFKSFITSVHYDGITLFVPTNSAWARLGPKANAFLFNCEKGRKYLKALLKYQLAPDVVLYSDAVYDNRKHEDAEFQHMGYETEHYDLPTYLGGARLSVDIARFLGFATVKVNGFSRVILSDGVSKNGVIQVVDRIFVPQHKHKHSLQEHQSLTGEVDVEDLIARLDPYMEE